DLRVLCMHFQHQHDSAPPDLANAYVRVLNEKVAEQVAAHPERLVGLGAVSLQHPELAAEQLTHAMRELGLRGVMMTTTIGAEEITAPRFEPCLRTPEARGAVALLH